MTTTVATLDRPVPVRVGTRVRTGLLAVWAAVTGAAPHVLHHVGPLAGTAIVADAGGRSCSARPGSWPRSRCSGACGDAPAAGVPQRWRSRRSPRSSRSRPWWSAPP